jgi:hypothetical protein
MDAPAIREQQMGSSELESPEQRFRVFVHDWRKSRLSHSCILSRIDVNGVVRPIALDGQQSGS